MGFFCWRIHRSGINQRSHPVVSDSRIDELIKEREIFLKKINQLIKLSTIQNTSKRIQFEIKSFRAEVDNRDKPG